MFHKRIAAAVALIFSSSLLAQNWIGLSQQLDILQSGSSLHTMFNDGDTSIYLGGRFVRDIENNTLSKIARWDGQQLHSVGCGFNFDCENEDDMSTWVGGVASIIRFQDTLYAAGSFYFSGDQPLQNVAKWDGQNWKPVGTGFDASVITLTEIEDTLYACGSFSFSGITPLNGLSKWNGIAWLPVNDFPQFYTTSSNQIADIEFFQNTFYVGGNFSNNDATLRDLVYWNGNSWEEVGGGFFGGLMSVSELDILDNRLVITGSMSTDENSQNPGTGIVGWDGSTWFDFQGGTDDPETNITGAVFDIQNYNDRIYIAGNFRQAGDVAANQLAFWDEDHWCSFVDTFQISGFQTNVEQTIFFQDTLYALGHFDGISGTENIIGIAKYLGGDTCEISPVVEQEVAVPILIYPNPTSDLININTREGHSELKIFDTLGQLLLTKNINTQSSIDVSQLKAGIYLLSIESENGKVVKRFVKE